MTDRTRTRRIAAKSHDCGSNVSWHCTPIAVGDAYLEITTFPIGRKLNSQKQTVRRVRQCVYCAAVDGQDYLLTPIPAGQDYRYWDIDSEKLARDRDAALGIFAGVAR